MARQLQPDCDLFANAALLPVVCQCMSCMALYASSITINPDVKLFRSQLQAAMIIKARAMHSMAYAWRPGYTARVHHISGHTCMLSKAPRG